MEYRQLGKTDLMVSPVCMGTSGFGTRVARDFSLWQLDAFADMGANFIDTARVYGDWEPGEKGRSEKLIGEWLRKSGKRDKMVIMTKGGHPLLETMHISRCVPVEIGKDIDESLMALGVDTIDLYLLHRDNPGLPVEILLQALEQARLKGKLRYYGFSNWKLPRIREAEEHARQAGIAGFSCNQVMWSLAEINSANLADKTMVSMDRETYQWHCGSALSVTAYHATAHGWFSKLEKGQDVNDKLKLLYDNDKNRAIFDLIRQASAELGIPAIAVSLAYFTGHPFGAVPITSFSQKQQLEETLRFCGSSLGSDLVLKFNAIKGLV
jgi:aryl-alcohol dehydrogenase-like predicted oxidoreductase